MTLSDHLKAGNVLLWIVIFVAVVCAYIFRDKIKDYLDLTTANASGYAAHHDRYMGRQLVKTGE